MFVNESLFVCVDEIKHIGHITCTGGDSFTVLVTDSERDQCMGRCLVMGHCSVNNSWRDLAMGSSSISDRNLLLLFLIVLSVHEGGPVNSRCAASPFL